MIASNTRLSDYYTIADLTPTSTGIPNLPTQNELSSLKRLASVLDLIRTRLGPFRIASGYRSPLVNSAVGGSTTSRHMKGEAVDIIPIGKSAERYWTQILADNDIRTKLGEISYKKPQGSIHLSLPYRSSYGFQVIGSARLAEGSPMVYKSISTKQETDFLAKYDLIDTRRVASIEDIYSNTAQKVQDLFKNVAPQSNMGKAVMVAGMGSLVLVLFIRRK